MARFAVLFPGQGSQYVGMGRDLYASSPAARAVIDQADQIWGGQLSRLLFEGPAEELMDTANAQPAIFVMSMACWAALREALGGETQLQPAFVAGHSLGEYTALAVAEAISFADGLHLVRERGQAMKAAGAAQPGKMAAVLGLDTETVFTTCEEASAQVGEPVVIANDNAPGQTVISGTHVAVNVAGELAKARGAKRVLHLAVSIAAHSPLMEAAVARFAPVLQRIGFTPPRLPVIGNVFARPLSTVTEAIGELSAQLTSQVRWTASIRYMAEQGVSTFIEVGPRDVLTGLVKRITPMAEGIACGTVDGVNQAARLLREQAAQA